MAKDSIKALEKERNEVLAQIAELQKKAGDLGKKLAAAYKAEGKKPKDNK